jgi:membrane protein DedA with SNARE-associated domain
MDWYNGHVVELLMNLDSVTDYTAVFVGLVLFGGVILTPIVYLATIDAINTFHLTLLVTAAAVFSDSLWYALGRYLTKERLYSLPYLRNRMKQTERFSAFYERNGIRVVFLAKFVYGTRVVTQILAGMHRANFWKYLFAVTVGSVGWMWMLIGISYTINAGLGGIENTALKLQLAFLLLVIVVVIVSVAGRAYANKKWTDDSK